MHTHTLGASWCRQKYIGVYTYTHTTNVEYIIHTKCLPHLQIRTRTPGASWGRQIYIGVYTYTHTTNVVCIIYTKCVHIYTYAHAHLGQADGAKRGHNEHGQSPAVAILCRDCVWRIHSCLPAYLYCMYAECARVWMWIYFDINTYVHIQK